MFILIMAAIRSVVLPANAPVLFLLLLLAPQFLLLLLLAFFLLQLQYFDAFPSTNCKKQHQKLKVLHAEMEACLGDNRQKQRDGVHHEQ